LSKASFEKLQRKFERNWARIQDDDDGDAGSWTPVDRYEARQARGYDKIAGKTVPVDGQVARSGSRRILPEKDDPQTRLILAEKLKVLIPEVLHGKNATIFEALVLNPLYGKPKRTPEELAIQFGTTRANIDRCLYKARRKVAAAQADRMAAAEAKRKALDETACRDAKLCPRGDQCCIVAHPNGIYGDEGCQCRRPWLELFTREPRIEDLRQAIDSMWEHERAYPMRKNVNVLFAVGERAGYAPKDSNNYAVFSEFRGRLGRPRTHI
jgi:hypothetical protein